MLTKFVESYVQAIGDMDMTTFEPLSLFGFHPMFDKEWIARIEKCMEYSKHVSMDDLAKKIKNASHLRAQLCFILMDLKTAGIAPEKRKKIAEWVYSLLEKLAKKDVNGFKSNIKHTHSEIEKIMKKKFEKGSIEAGKLLGRLYTSAYHLVNGLYTDFYTDWGIENIGPYDLGDGRILVIKKFANLNPKLLWAHTKDFPCSGFTIYSVYKDVKFSCDAISVHTQYEGDPIKGLESFRVEIDGKETHQLGVLKVLNEFFEKKSAEQWDLITSLDHEELKKKTLLMRCFIFKDFFEHLGIHWIPNKEMFDAIKDKPWSTIYNPPKKDQNEYWRNVLDPKEEFYPS
tara:strand:+ start:4681 stop:5709 length:1029 start_codon:yes stop_codon:yes gene_type:complete